MGREGPEWRAFPGNRYVVMIGDDKPEPAIEVQPYADGVPKSIRRARTPEGQNMFVWRRLWIERDSMAAPGATVNQMTATMTREDSRVPAARFWARLTIDSGQLMRVHAYRGGTLRAMWIVSASPLIIKIAYHEVVDNSDIYPGYPGGPQTANAADPRTNRVLLNPRADVINNDDANDPPPIGAAFTLSGPPQFWGPAELTGTIAAPGRVKVFKLTAVSGLVPSGDRGRFQMGKFSSSSISGLVARDYNSPTDATVYYADLTNDSVVSANSIVFLDDDRATLPQIIDTSLIDAWLGKAFLQPRYDTGSLGWDQQSIAFKLNVEGPNNWVALLTTANQRQSKPFASNELSVAYLQAAFQGPSGDDLDPYDELFVSGNVGLLGVTAQYNFNQPDEYSIGAFAFSESIIDNSRRFDLQDAIVPWRRVVVHEFFHQLRLKHPDLDALAVGTIMDAVALNRTPGDAQIQIKDHQYRLIRQRFVRSPTQ